MGASEEVTYSASGLAGKVLGEASGREEGEDGDGLHLD